MALNLVRNSRVFFTSNVNSSTGVINPSGFTSTNTQELQVLDGFTFSQNTNQDTVTLSEAGSSPVRGQRSFNTSLAPVDFSFSTYVRPYNAGTSITAEESVLWNALLSPNSSTATAVSLGSVTGATYTVTGSKAEITLAGTAITGTSTTTSDTSIAVGDIITLTGYVTSTATDAVYINAPGLVTAASTTGVTMTMINPKPGMAAISGITNQSAPKVYKSAWVPATSSYSLASSGTSNVNQLQKFGMLFVVDNVTYAVDNCAMNQVTLDFGLDSIATLAWTGQATALRDATDIISLTTGGGATVTGTALTGLASTDNIVVGQTITATGGTGALAASTTVTAIVSSTALTLSTAATTNGSLSGIKLVNAIGTGTLGSITGTGPYSATITALANTTGISVGDAITATANTGAFGAGYSAVVSGIPSGGTSLNVTITPDASTPITPTPGSLAAVTVTIATLTSATTLAAGPKEIRAPFITNKLSTVTFKTLNALGSKAAATYKVALTGGSITINNNISYVTPANLGVVNVPAVYYTGTRAISGTLNAYLKTGTGEGGTGQLLADMLAASSSSVEPMAYLSIAVGGSTNKNRVEVEMPSVTFTIPSIDVQQVISTAINFTAEGSVPSSTTDGNTFAVDKLNDLMVRYYAA